MSNNKSFAVQWRAGLFAAPLLFNLLGCNRTETKATEEKLEATPQSIQRMIVNVSCLSCHTEATKSNRGVALGDITKLIEGNGHSHEHGSMRILIKPGCPKQSFFLSIMKEGKMPPSPAAKTPSDNLKVIEDWIVSLKPNAGKSCDDDEPPDLPGGGDEP